MLYFRRVWRVAGTYFESCNCDAICPCRRTGGAEGGKSTHGVCDFALSWWIQQGHHGDEKLDGMAVVMAGSYQDRVRWTPWEVALLVDERASMRAQSALTEIFAGEAAAPDGAVSCGIPGHDHPGTEVHARLLSVDESGLRFRYSGVCGFTTSFDYSSDS